MGFSNQNNYQYSLNSLASTFGSSFGGNKFISANALWVQSDIQLNQNFITQFKSFDNGNYYFVDFLNNPDKAGDQINAWVQD